MCKCGKRSTVSTDHIPYFLDWKPGSQSADCVLRARRPKEQRVNLNVEFCRRLERITSTPSGVKMSRGV